MTVADATPDFEQGTLERPRVPRPSEGSRLPRLHRGVRALLLLLHADAATLYMVNYLLLPGRMEKVIGLNWLQAHVYHGIAGPAARVGDLRHLRRARLLHADHRRDHRRQVARAGPDADHRWRADGASATS